MVKGMTRLKEISENVAGDQLNVERCVKELLGRVHGDVPCDRVCV